MNQMSSAMQSAGRRKRSIAQQTGQGISQAITNGIRSGVSAATAAMSQMISSIQSRAMAGVGAMRSAGSMIGQGLAQGMMSALPAVTAAANALVAQAEKAAQAKAKIHSPSRLFRDNVGRFISQGVAVGISASSGDIKTAITDTITQAEDYAVSSLGGLNVVSSVDYGTGAGSTAAQPMELIMNFGNRAFRAFVEDITSAQEVEMRLSDY